MSFGEKIRAFRDEKNLTQPEFAKMIGVSVKTLVHYEAGDRYPRDIEVYRKIAAVMDCDYNYLMGDGEDFLSRVYSEHGKRELDKVKLLTEGVSSLFAGGELSDDDKDIAFEAITRAYWKAKKENKKYGRKKQD